MNLLLAITLAASLRSFNGPLVSPANDGDFVFVVAGDNRPTAHGAPWPRVLPAIFSEIRLIRPDFALWTGDTIYGYDDTREQLRKEYSEFEALAKHAGVPIFNAPGNHEIHDLKNQIPCAELEAEFQKHFDLFGSFDYRGAHFIALDTEECGHSMPAVDGRQLEWLQQDLEANRNARAIFIFFHTEITQAALDEDKKNHPPLANSADLQALFEKYPVKAVFQGHEHIFHSETRDGIRYFVAGGAGAPLYAQPENGGFSHYLVVEISKDQVTYKVVEPGHFYQEEGEADTRNPAERMLWLVNSGDLPLPAGRIEASVPGTVGACADLVVETRLTKYDGTPIPVPMKIGNCTPAGKTNNLTIVATDDVPRRSSVPVYVHRK